MEPNNTNNTKPWLSIPKDTYMWRASSNHKTLPKNREADIMAIDAFYLVQEANMGGKYYRVIFWINNDGKYERYFSISNDHKWIFDIKLEAMEKDMIITDIRTGNKFKVIKSSEFIKLLEIID